MERVEAAEFVFRPVTRIVMQHSPARIVFEIASLKRQDRTVTPRAHDRSRPNFDIQGHNLTGLYLLNFVMALIRPVRQ